MELYILDSFLRRIEVIDRFESLIWSERFSALGDFQIVIESTKKNRDLFLEGTRLSLTESQRVMVVETILDKIDDDGRAMLTLSGRSLEAIMEDRVARPNMQGLDASPRWALSGTPGEIVRFIFKRICQDGILDQRDKIPFITTGSVFPSNTIPEPEDEIKVELEPDTLLNSVSSMCNAYGLGFALARGQDTSKLYFQVYSGSNRTSSQTNLPAVIFSPELDSLTNVSELVSIEAYKNVAYVLANTGTAIVYADGIDPTDAGFERRVLMVKVDNVTPTADEEGLSLTDLLQKRGRDALDEHRRIAAFDGEIPTSGYKYGIDYRLGDVVEMRKNTGATNYMRVTEQIFVSDGEGDRSYPTLALDLFITPGSWYAWDANEVWDEAEGTWDEA